MFERKTKIKGQNLIPAHVHRDVHLVKGSIEVVSSCSKHQRNLVTRLFSMPCNNRHSSRWRIQGKRRLQQHEVYFLKHPIDLTTIFCLSRQIPCVVHKIPFHEMFCRCSSDHKIKCMLIPSIAVMTRPTLPPLP